MEITVFQGLLNNIFITVGSCLLPIAVGFVTYWLCNNNESLTKMAHICGTLFESLCPLVTIIFLYHCVFGKVNVNSIWVCIVGFSISFIGYMPLRYESENSMIKNLVVNTIGLFSTVFKWSFCAGYIGKVEMLRAACIQMSMTYDSGHLWTPMIISFVIVLVLELMKYVVKERL